MSDSEFQTRLQRINAGSHQSETMQRPAKLRYRLLFVGALSMAVGLQIVKSTNKNYDAIRDSAGGATAALLGLAGIVIVLFGCISIMRSVSRKRLKPEKTSAYGYSITGERSTQGATTSKKASYLLLGTVFGTSACVLMFLASAARFIETQPAQVFIFTTTLVAFLLVIAALLFGIVGIFRRGSGLWRVPFYCVFSIALTFAVIRVSGINFLAWRPFVEMLS